MVYCIDRFIVCELSFYISKVGRYDSSTLRIRVEKQEQSFFSKRVVPRNIFRIFAPEHFIILICSGAFSVPLKKSKEHKNMEFLTGAVQKEDLGIAEILAGDYEGKNIKVKGAIHTIRDMGEVAFIVLRRRDGLVQCVYEPGKSQFSVDDLKEADTVEVCGTYKSDDRSPNGFELRLDTITILSEPAEPMPLQINKWKLNTSLEAKLNNRAVALRNPRERATFRIQEGITRGFRDFLYNNGFTEIHTPKLGAKSAEGGANLFKLEYFHRPAILQQSPQFYKQMMVGVFDRVFETAPVFRAEKHNTKRHLNEYTSLDFEMGYIDGFEDIMEMETGFCSTPWSF